jgi:hypothetical protein
MEANISTSPTSEKMIHRQPDHLPNNIHQDQTALISFKSHHPD